VSTNDGNTVRVTTSAGSTVTRTMRASVKGIHPGETILISGVTGANGAIAAESIRVGANPQGDLGGPCSAAQTPGLVRERAKRAAANPHSLARAASCSCAEDECRLAAAVHSQITNKGSHASHRQQKEQARNRRTGVPDRQPPADSVRRLLLAHRRERLDSRCGWRGPAGRAFRRTSRVHAEERHHVARAHSSPQTSARCP
jgi:hypothetical protein